MIYDLNGQAIAPYNKNGMALPTAYNVDGDTVYSVDYSNYSITDFCSVSFANMQGFDIYNGIIFQFRAGSSISNKMITINRQTQSIISSDIDASSDHGDSATFAKEFYSESDDYPLIYVTADTNPAKVYVNRVTQSSSQLIKTFVFPLEKTGYYAALCLDEDNGIMYMIGYKEQNYLTDNGGSNTTVISKWDLSNLTDNGDGTFTPAFILSYERSFIYCMQGQQYYDGMLWISSGYTSTHGYIYALDPVDGALLYTVDTNSTVEIEGLAFINSNEMIFGLQGGTYKKVTFSIV